MRFWRALSMAPALGLALALCGCGAARAGTALDLPPNPAALPAPKRSHVVVIMLENRELGEVIGAADAPYLNQLAGRYLLATHYYAVAHPSLPNYISLIAGSTLGISTDCSECVAHGGTIVEQMEAAHESWGAFMEGFPSPCFTGEAAGEYVKRHDPFVYFPQITQDPQRCRRIVSLSALAADLRGGRLPDFAWISPNLCDDGHDCGNASVSAFLARTVPYILRELGAHGLLAIVWDEGSSDRSCCSLASGGVVPLILAGPDVRAHARFSVAVDHFSLLALIERIFGLPALGEAACPCTPSLAGAFRHNRPPRLRGGV